MSLYTFNNQLLVASGVLALASSQNCCCSGCQTLLSTCCSARFVANYFPPECDVLADDLPPPDPKPDFTRAAQEIMDQLNLKENGWIEAQAAWSCTCEQILAEDDPDDNIEVQCDPETESIATVIDKDCTDGDFICCTTKQTDCGFGASAKCCKKLNYSNMVEYQSEPYDGDWHMEGGDFNFTTVQIDIDGQTVFVLKATVPECS